MTSTSCDEIARGVLDRSVAGNPPDELPRALLEESCGKALFGILVEGLADRFEPALCDVYARLFSQAIAYVDGALEPASLVTRYGRVRPPRPVSGEPRRVFVLSRVTLGADVAITSVLLDAAKLRFPQAEIVFAGPGKNYEMFAGDPRVRHAEIGYRRGGLCERLAGSRYMRELFSAPDSLVIDPDSRLTQLGLLPVCPEDRYRLFESRAYGGESDSSLPDLAAAWAAETLGVIGAKPWVALAQPPEQAPDVAVSFGVGENPAKRLPDPFEPELLATLSRSGASVCIDTGAGGEEAERVRRAVEHSRIAATLWQGSFAGFAAIIAASRLYIGYDSAGQHVAAACGVPLISVFTGFAAPRMFHRWSPAGARSTVIRMDRPEPREALAAVAEALELHGPPGPPAMPWLR